MQVPRANLICMVSTLLVQLLSISGKEVQLDLPFRYVLWGRGCGAVCPLSSDVTHEKAVEAKNGFLERKAPQ